MAVGETVEAYLVAVDSQLRQEGGAPGGQSRAVGTDADRKPLGPGMANDVEEILAQQGLAAGDGQIDDS